MRSGASVRGRPDAAVKEHPLIASDPIPLPHNPRLFVRAGPVRGPDNKNHIQTYRLKSSPDRKKSSRTGRERLCEAKKIMYEPRPNRQVPRRGRPHCPVLRVPSEERRDAPIRRSPDTRRDRHAGGRPGRAVCGHLGGAHLDDSEHVELAPHLDAVLATVGRPDRRAADLTQPGREQLSKRGVGPTRWLVAVVDFADKPARIVTAYGRGRDKPPTGRTPK